MKLIFLIPLFSLIFCSDLLHDTSPSQPQNQTLAPSQKDPQNHTIYSSAPDQLDMKKVQLFMETILQNTQMRKSKIPDGLSKFAHQESPESP
jgi:hypothetical protein